MNDGDPYTAPATPDKNPESSDRLTHTSLLLSGIALSALFMVSVWYLMLCTFLAIPGLITGILAIRKNSIREAKFSVAISLFVCLYLPTILHTFISALRK